MIWAFLRGFRKDRVHSDPLADASSNREAFLESLRKVEKLREEQIKAAEFRPGELSHEEEELVKEKGLNALNYIPQRTLRRQAKAFQNHADRMRHRTEVRSRPETDPERRKLEAGEAAERLQRGLRDRFDGAGYGMFLFVIAAFTLGIIDAHGWPVGIFCCLLMLAVLELGYRLASR